jgi:phosphate transport system substrate-binding protein
MRFLRGRSALLRALPLGLGSIAIALAACTTNGGGTAAGSAPTSASVAGNMATVVLPTRPAGAPTPIIVESAIQIKGPYPGEAKALDGAGSTFIAPLYTKWFSDYEKLTGVKANYQAVGSGGGIKAIQDATVDFGASDAFMTDEQLRAAKGEILHIPQTLGAVVATYNIPNFTGRLRLTPETLAGIFLGEITKWNDPRLVADNPGLANINQDIITVHRSDGSGTTAIFVDYLSTVSPKWQATVGRGTSVNWPVGLGGKGNDGVTGEVKQNPYSIGYVELIYALQQNLGYADIKNKAGNFVTPSLDSVTAAAAGVADRLPADLRVSIVNADGADAYPISGFAWALVYKNMTNREKAIALTRLLWWSLHDGQRVSTGLGYAPLPEAVVKRAQEMVNSITVSGQKAFPGQ